MNSLQEHILDLKDLDIKFSLIVCSFSEKVSDSFELEDHTIVVVVASTCFAVEFIADEGLIAAFGMNTYSGDWVGFWALKLRLYDAVLAEHGL